MQVIQVSSNAPIADRRRFFNCSLSTARCAMLLAIICFCPAVFAQDAPSKEKGANSAKAAGDAAAGKALFEVKCSICHNADSTEKKIGPGLKGIKDGALPSGKNTTHDAILEKLNAGGGGMPVFKELLTDKEKADIVAYVLTL